MKKNIKEGVIMDKWSVNEFIPNIITKDISGASYYVWSKLPSFAKVTQSNSKVGETVFRAHDLKGKSSIHKKHEYIIVNVDSPDGSIKIRQSKYDFERAVFPDELCRKYMSTYATTKKIADLERNHALFFEVDKATAKKVKKKLKRM